MRALEDRRSEGSGSQLRARACVVALGMALLAGACGEEGGDGAPSRIPTGEPVSGANHESSSNGGAPRSEPEEGSQAAAPGVPTSREGDNSIQTWGHEASSEQRTAAGEEMQVYLDARAAREWAEACSHLAAELRAELPAQTRTADCAEAMASTSPRSDAALVEEARIEVLSLRIGREFSFLIYRRPDGVYAMPLVREDGGWRLYLVTPTPIG